MVVEIQIETLVDKVWGLDDSPETRELIGTELNPLLCEIKEMGLALHGNHSNVGPAKRIEEWSRCSYTFCKRRYTLVFGDSK